MPTVLRFEAIGTRWQITLQEPLSAERATDLETRVRERIARFDLAYSRFRPDSTVSRMAREAGRFAFPDDFGPMIDAYRRLYDATDGAVTPLIGGALEDAGYDASYSLRPKAMRPVPAWDDVMRVEGNALVTTAPVRLDFGAAGKGYLIDLVADVLWAEGLRAFTVDAGGDILHRGPAPLRVALEDPGEEGKAIGVATIADRSICGSAGNRRRWADFHHVINPHTLRSPGEVLAVWTVAETTLLADALSTGLFFTSAAKLRQSFPFEYLIVFADRSADASPGFPAEVF